jgi:hypothetical protein
LRTIGQHLDAEHFTKRLLTDCLDEATRGYWLKRALQFEAARPGPGDFHGQATRADLRRRWQELTDIANACRSRAQVAPLDEIAPDLENVWQEVA